jgi:hypothetical protein
MVRAPGYFSQELLECGMAWFVGVICILGVGWVEKSLLCNAVGVYIIDACKVN